MNGKGSIRFLELFADTVAAHGWQWANAEYARCGMELWERRCWFRAIGYTGAAEWCE